MRTLPRAAGERVRRLLRSFPAVQILGPRQCGKSTLVRLLLPDWNHFDLERPSDRAQVSTDLEEFLDQHPRRLAIDEAQAVPELFPALRSAIDRGRGHGRFVLTGSASPALVRAVSESLAGRVAIVELAPFSGRELHGVRGTADRWYWGGFPPVHRQRSTRARLEWFDTYVTTVLERDIPALGIRVAAAQLRRLWIMLTHVHGSLLNVSDLARSLGVSPHTVSDHLDVLEGAFLIRRLQPFFANVQKRLTKSPKLYIRDTGLLHFLAGLRRPGDLPTWLKRGHSFEGMVIEEMIGLACERLVRPEFWFWRTQAGGEVDLLVGDGQRLLPLEIKLGAIVDPRQLGGLRQCMKDLGIKKGYVVCTGKERRRLGQGIEVVPWADVLARREDFGL